MGPVDRQSAIIHFFTSSFPPMKFTHLLLMILLVFSTTACSSTPSTTTDETQDTPSVQENSSSNTADDSVKPGEESEKIDDLGLENALLELDMVE